MCPACGSLSDGYICELINERGEITDTYVVCRECKTRTRLFANPADIKAEV